MAPALRPGDRVIARTWWLNPIKGDIVILKNADPDLIIKRVKKVKGAQYWVEGEGNHPSTDSRQFGWKAKDQFAGVVIKVIKKF